MPNCRVCRASIVVVVIMVLGRYLIVGCLDPWDFCSAKLPSRCRLAGLLHGGSCRRRLREKPRPFLQVQAYIRLDVYCTSVGECDYVFLEQSSEDIDSGWLPLLSTVAHIGPNGVYVA